MTGDMATKLLEESLGKIVLVKLKGGKSLRGSLISFDQHMNLLLENAEEVTDSEKPQKLGTIVVRGDNVTIISPSPR